MYEKVVLPVLDCFDKFSSYGDSLLNAHCKPIENMVVNIFQLL